jgi:3D (Asp-Asp-Asp) domain-containing protein
VTFEIIDEKVAIPPPVVTRWDRRMTVKPVVIRAGKPGVAVQKRCVWKIDGKISEQWTQGKKVVKKPVPSVVVRGNLASRGLTTRRTLRMVATAYDPGPGSCGPHANGHTAIGMHAGRGVIAVDPRIIPLGTRVYVEGYGAAVAADVGSAIKGNIIDVCFPTRGEALRWGRRYVNVTIID